MIAMMTTHLSTLPVRDKSFEVGRTTRDHFEQFELRSTVPSRQPVGSDLDSTVQIYPAELVKRERASWDGIVTETIYAAAQSRVEFMFDAPAHLLVMYDYGARRQGETSIGELAPSRLRNFASKLTFAPVGHTYREWHETSVPMRITYLYLDPIRLQQRAEANVVYSPRVFVEDPVLWETAAKLRSVIYSRRPEGRRYSEALASVLVHELFRSGHESRVHSENTSDSGRSHWLANACNHQLYRGTSGRADFSYYAGSYRSAQPVPLLSRLQAIVQNSAASISCAATHRARKDPAGRPTKFGNKCRIDSRLFSDQLIHGCLSQDHRAEAE